MSLSSPPQAVLAMEDVGDSLDTNEALLKKQEDFEKTMAAQEEKFKVIPAQGNLWCMCVCVCVCVCL